MLTHQPPTQVLDLNHNQLVSCRGLETCTSLCDLRLAHNRLADLRPLAGLQQLQVGLVDWWVGQRIRFFYRLGRRASG